MARIVILPGVCGSAISLDRWIVNTDYWCSPPNLAAFGPWPLIVDPAGQGDGFAVGFRRTLITGILATYYGRLVEFLRSQGFKVLPLGFDWRLGIRTVAGGALDAARDWAGDEPFYLLAHSLGVLVGRAMIRLATAMGVDGQIVRLVTMGTPHQGSLSIPRLWGRLDPSYQLLAALFFPHLLAGHAIRSGAEVLDPLDEVIATLVSPYSLMPQPGSPNLANPDQYNELMDYGTYAGFNTYLNPQRFTDARAEHVWLQGAIYPAKQLSLFSDGVPTVYAIKDIRHLNKNSSYFAANNGDGTVDENTAQLPGVSQYRFHNIQHAAWPYDSGVLPVLPRIILEGRL